jgi:DHA1 family tetracycline resistance protein-like MFS transporter
MGGTCLGLILTGIADTLLLVFVGRILSGIFAANISVASAYVADITTEENRSKGMGMIGAAFGIGFLLGPALGGTLSHYGYHVPILTAAILTAVNMIYASLRLTEPKRHHTHPEEIIQTKVLSHRPILKICLVYFIFTLGVTQLESIFAFFMMDRFQYDAMHVAYILAMMALVMVAIQGGLIRILTQKYGENLLFISGVMILSFAFFLIPKSASVPLLLLPLSFAAVGRGISQPSLLSLISKKAPPHMRGAVMGTFQASASLGRVVGPALAGLFYDQWQASPFYFAAILMVAVFLISMNL